MSSPDAALFWFRRDLRLRDNPALLAAVRGGGPVIPVFIWSPDEEGPWTPGAASRWWLHQSLANLMSALRERGSQLILCRGPAEQAIRKLLTKAGATRVFWNRVNEPAVHTRDQYLSAALTRQGVQVEAFHDALLLKPDSIRTKGGRPYQVFSAYWRAALEQLEVSTIKPPPRRIPAPRRFPASLRLDDLSLEPAVDWAGGLRDSWRPGAEGAHRELERFLRGAINSYATDRDRPDLRGTSRLSPHLHFGEISVREVWEALESRKRRSVRGRLRPAAVERYRSELGWREFAHYLLWHFPQTPKEPLRPEFADFPWEQNGKQLRAWQRGRTGYPIVDAGMRELWHSGWMHNRVRMLVASFLVKDLRIPWQSGAAWFWDTLVDADLANNTLGWQWTAGCGADAAPYFRVFNPVTQGEKFDPQGDYVRRWVPELARLPRKWIHKPWHAPAQVLAAADVELGSTYPLPIVDHAAARSAALAAFKELRRERTP